MRIKADYLHCLPSGFVGSLSHAYCFRRIEARSPRFLIGLSSSKRGCVLRSKSSLLLGCSSLRCYNYCPIFMDILATLNPAQREATQAIKGPVLILAGPGSGKTRVITHRVAYLVKVCGVSPHHIMAVTFTNKAAREMKERLHQLLGQAIEALTLGTFHAICARILRRDGKAVGLDSSFLIYDEEDQLRLVKQVLE